MKAYLRALAFLTVIPLPFVPFDEEGKDLAGAAAFFPLAGATLGLVLAAVAWMLLKVFPPLPTVVIVLIINFFLTRGIHFDGLTDTADGLIGTTDREKAFRAMKDSSVGVMGAAVLFFVYLLKVFLLAEFTVEILPLALIIVPLAGRWAIVYSGVWYQPASGQGLGELFLRHLRWPLLIKASLVSVVFLAILTWWQPALGMPAILGCLAALISSHLLAAYAAFRLGGLTGDILGANSELGELIFIIFFYLGLSYF